MKIFLKYLLMHGRRLFAFAFILLHLLLWNGSEIKAQKFSEWDTNLSIKSIELNELKSGGPPEDGIFPLMIQNSCQQRKLLIRSQVLNP